MKELSYLDLFAGAGGLAEGFNRAGVNPVAFIEMDSEAANTLKTRLAYHFLKNNNRIDLYRDYLSEHISRYKLYHEIPQKIHNKVINETISDKSIKLIFEKIDLLLKNRNLDLIIGGPPCQAYSLVGRARDPEGKINDPKNFLYKYFLEFLKKYKPRMFVFENVPGLLSAGNKFYYNDLKKRAEKIGYCMDAKILDATDFGVVQTRKRVIVIGWRTEYELTYPVFQKSEKKYNVKDIFSDLPSLEPGGLKNSYIKKANECLHSLQIRNGLDILSLHQTRPVNNLDREIYRIAINKWNNERRRLNYNELPNRLKTHNNHESFLDRFKVVDLDGKSHTLVAHIAKDGHYYIHPKIKQARSISVREAARIQSFPDDYFFEGSRTSVLKQIGNAVPVLMAEQIGKTIMELI